MTKEILEAIEIIKKYFQTPENFQTKQSKVEGALISNWMDMITIIVLLQWEILKNIIFILNI